jgi:hypothetical protein
MASPMEAQLILADSAVADPSGKIHMLGAGWSTTTSPTPPHAVAVLAKVPWDRANQKMVMKLRLLDADGHPVELDTQQGKAGIGTTGEIEVGRPPGVPPGITLDAGFAVNVQPLPLPPGRYHWQLEIAEMTLNAFFTVLGSNHPF